jgi:hypothetical protein
MRFPIIQRRRIGIMNRKMLLFASSLFLLMAIRYAFGQDQGIEVGWEPDVYHDPLDCIFGLMVGAPILGSVFGAVRVLAGRSARPVLEPICLK